MEPDYIVSCVIAVIGALIGVALTLVALTDTYVSKEALIKANAVYYNSITGELVIRECKEED